jgi:CRP-like cAMP-binding protein
MLLPTWVVQPGNHLLDRLPEGEFERLSQLMEFVSLPVRKVLYKARAPLDYVYFPTSGIVSAMTVMEDGDIIEVATIGNEGVAGLTAFIGGKTSPYEVMVQVAGEGLRMRADAFENEASRNGPLRKILVLYNTAFSIQVAYSVACNGLHTLEKRCCRWLLLTQDRVESNSLPLTHEFLAIMLGVQRPSVTLVLRPLQDRGVISNRRGMIEILDRPRLEALACECYRTVSRDFARLFDIKQ